MDASPDAVGLQVRDVERAAEFYRRHFGFESDPSAPPGVVLFKTDTIPFLIREPLPGTNLDAGPVGNGISISLRVEHAQALHDRLKAAGVAILLDPFDTPIGRTFMFRDPEGYALAIHGTVG